LDCTVSLELLDPYPYFLGRTGHEVLMEVGKISAMIAADSEGILGLQLDSRPFNY